MTPSELGRMLENRTAAWLISLGYRAERVSRPTAQGRRGKVDLFGVVDVVSVHPEHGVELHQVTTKLAASARRRKIRDAGIPWPVRLWLWRKERVDGKGPLVWVSTSEVVEPVHD
jgi:hypothetical protein